MCVCSTPEVTSHATFLSRHFFWRRLSNFCASYASLHTLSDSCFMYYLQLFIRTTEIIFSIQGNKVYLMSSMRLKGLSYEIDFENVDENLQILALIRAATGF